MNHEPRPAIHMENQLGCGRVSGDLQGWSNSVATLTVSHIWHQLAGSEAGEFGKGTMASAHLSSCMPLMPFKMLPWYCSSEGVSLSR